MLADAPAYSNIYIYIYIYMYIYMAGSIFICVRTRAAPQGIVLPFFWALHCLTHLYKIQHSGNPGRRQTHPKSLHMLETYYTNAS
jgi:hypothetical protein